MGHQKFDKTGKPDRPLIETEGTVAPRIKDTQKELEKLHRQQLVKRSATKGEKIRSKTRAYEEDLRRGYKTKP